MAVLSTSMTTYLYWKVVPGAKFTVAVHMGFVFVYPLADIATPELTLHVPSWLIDPTSITLCCHEVVTFSLNVTATTVDDELLLDVVEVLTVDVVELLTVEVVELLTVDVVEVLTVEVGNADDDADVDAEVL